MAYRVVGYDPKTQSLTIQFEGGEVYEYAEVSPDLAEATEYAAAMHLPGWLQKRVIPGHPARRVKGPHEPVRPS